LSHTTKSDLVERDAEMLGQIPRSNIVHEMMTITTTDERLARLVEPYAPRPSLRFKAIRSLTDAGVRVMVFAMPVMPLITDSEKNLSAVASAAKEAGAMYMAGGVLFLKPCAQNAFYPFLEQHFPHLVKKYRERYASSAFIRGPYEEMIAKRVNDIRVRFGLTQKFDRYEPELWRGEPQLSLFGGDPILQSSPNNARLPPRSTLEQRIPAARTAPLHRRSR
jgi:DNA repair photolyase